jgi:uncharacterized RDD family membrane protein YckC/uncharacterized Zn finger protein (UPF0148 family)
MKCPKCGFVSFDELVQCKKCGLYFKEPASAKVSEPKEQRQTQPEESSTSAARLPPQWSETIQSIKKELEEIEGKPIDLKSMQSDSLIKKETAAEETLTEAIKETAGVPAFPEFKILSAPKGGFFIRLVAYLIDSIILYFLDSLVLIATSLFLGKGSVSFDTTDLMGANLGYLLYYVVMSMMIGCFYFTYCHGVTVQTIGKWICGLKVVQKNGDPLGLGRAFLRWFGYWVSGFLFFFGFIWIAFSKQKQGWHDKIAGSYVIRV